MATLVSHVWKPSDARVARFDGPRTWPEKDPRDTLDYVLDLSAAVIGDEGDVISTADVDIQPSEAGDLTVDNVSADGQRIILWLAGGQVGLTYAVTVSVGLASGRAIERTITLPVAALSALSVPAPDGPAARQGRGCKPFAAGPPGPCVGAS